MTQYDHFKKKVMDFQLTNPASTDNWPAVRGFIREVIKADNLEKNGVVFFDGHLFDGSILNTAVCRIESILLTKVKARS